MKYIFQETEDGDNQNTDDNQLSLRKIEGVAFRGMRNDLDKVNLVSENDDMAKLSVLRPRGGDRTASAELGCHISWSCAGADRAVDGSPKPKESTTGGNCASGQCANVKPSLKNMIDKGERKRRNPST